MDARVRRGGRATTVAALVLLASLPFATAADTDRVATLPASRASFPAVTDGTTVYTFGGHYPATAEIWRYDPAAGTTTVAGASLPAEMDGMDAVWDPEAEVAYAFGGRAPSEFANAIWRYDPATDTLDLLETTLPDPGCGCRARGVWADGVVLLLRDSKAYTWDPATGDVVLDVADAPWWGSFTAVWAAGAAYVLYDGGVVRHVPGGTPDHVAGVPGGARWHSADMLVRDGADFLVLGGSTEGGDSDAVWRFSTDTHTFALDGKLPKPLWGAAAVGWGGDALLLGGVSHASTRWHVERGVMRYDPDAQASPPAPPPEPAGSLVGLHKPDGDTWHAFVHDLGRATLRDLGPIGRAGVTYEPPVLDVAGGRYVVRTWDDGPSISTLDLATGLWSHAPGNWPTPSAFHAAAWSERDGRMYGLSEEGDLHLVAFDPSTGAVLQAFPPFTGLTGFDGNGYVALDDVAGRLFVGAWDGASAVQERTATFDLATGALLGHAPRGGVSLGAAFHDAVTGRVWSHGYNDVTGIVSVDPATGHVDTIGGASPDALSGALDPHARVLYLLEGGDVDETVWTGYELGWGAAVFAARLPESATAVVHDPTRSLGGVAAPKPAQDDGGTGGDASDDPERPTFVRVGADGLDLAGEAAHVIDPVDAYGFRTDGADEVCVVLEPPAFLDLRLRLLQAGSEAATSDAGGLGEAESVCAAAANVEAGWTLVVETVALTQGGAFPPGAAGTAYSASVSCEPYCLTVAN